MKSKIILALSTLLLCTTIYVLNTPHKQVNSEEIAESPNGRDSWRSDRRSNNHAPQKIRAAKAALQAKVKKQGKQKDAGLNKWTELGPNNEGGRVRALAVHPTDPDILFAGGVSGGIWKSTNQGASWTALADFLPSPSVTCIIVHPTMPDTMYASTGESFVGGDGKVANGTPGDGIFRSFDGGDTWDVVPGINEFNDQDFYWTNKIAFDVDDPSIFYAVANGNTKSTTAGGCANLYKFIQNGNVASKISSFPCTIARGTTIVINPNDGDHMMVGTNIGLVISYNKGITWKTLSSFNSANWPITTGRVEVAMSIDDENRVYALCEGSGTNGILLSSDDKGLTWTSKNSALTIFNPSANTNNGWYHNVIWVDPGSKDRILIGGLDIWKSTDAGNSITKITDWIQNNAGTSPHADQHIIVAASDYDITSNRKIYIGNDGGVASTVPYTSATQTTGWDLLNNNSLGITQYYDSDIYGQDANFLIGGTQDNGTLYSDDSGASWTVAKGGDGGMCAISKQDPAHMYLSTQFGKFFTSCPPIVGTSFDYFNITDYELDSLFIQPMEIFPNDGLQTLIGGLQLYHITKDATTCLTTVVNRSPVNIIATRISEIEIRKTGNTVYVGYENGRIYKGNTTTPTWTWSLVYTDPTGRTVTDISINPNNANKVAASFGGYSADNIILTNDGGANWIPKTNGLPIIHINTLVWHPNKGTWLYAGTDLGIMATEDNGNNWNISPNWFGVADGPGFVEISKLQFTREGTVGGHYLVATTFGRGIWKSSTLVRGSVYLDENTSSVIFNGFLTTPYKIIEDAENNQAHGQTWFIDGGSYPVDQSGGKKIVLDKRLGEIQKTGAGSVILGDN